MVTAVIVAPIWKSLNYRCTSHSHVAYGASFFFLSLTLRTIPVGIAYAVWGGVGIALISLVGRQPDERSQLRCRESVYRLGRYIKLIEGAPEKRYWPLVDSN
jgi:hypothetical protein